MPVIGNKLKLAFELVPVTPSWETRYPPERACWAGTAIWVDGRNLCSHVAHGSTGIEDYFHVPLAPIVDWLVRAFPAIELQGRAPMFATTRDLHDSVERWGTVPPPAGVSDDDWLDAREQWWAQHFLRAGADGALVPNLAFVRDDEQLVAAWAAPRFSGENAPTMRWPEGQFSLPWYEGRSILEEFASSVAAWLRQTNLPEIHAWYPWVREENPVLAAAPPLSRAIELFTGRPLADLQSLFRIAEPGGLVLALDLDESSRDPAASPQCQILRDLSPQLTPEIGELLFEVTVQQQSEAARTWRDVRAIALDAARPARSPEEAGYLAAPEVRRAIGLDSEPIGNLTATLAQLGLQYAHTDVEGGRDQMIVAVRQDGMPAARTLETPRTKTTWGQRFEACRALGHALLDPLRAGVIGAASGPFAEATRRRRSGAFAAELLLPEAAIASANASRLDGAAEDGVFEGLLERYGVGARTAAYHLWNRRKLSSIEVRDDLVDRFGSTRVG